MAWAVSTQTSPIRRLRTIALFEGLSFLILLGVAMPLKYFGGMPERVPVLGPRRPVHAPVRRTPQRQTGGAVDAPASRACCHRRVVALRTVCY